MLPGLKTLFRPGEEILVAKNAREVLSILQETPDDAAYEIGSRARERVLRAHTSSHRAAELESFINAARSSLTDANRMAALGTMEGVML